MSVCKDDPTGVKPNVAQAKAKACLTGPQCFPLFVRQLVSGTDYQLCLLSQGRLPLTRQLRCSGSAPEASYASGGVLWVYVLPGTVQRRFTDLVGKRLRSCFAVARGLGNTQDSSDVEVLPNGIL